MERIPSMAQTLPLLAIDGAHDEGGGQLLRTAVALAAITGRSIAVGNIRAKRKQPGLAPQHRAAVAAVAALCDARVTGLALRSGSLTFSPGNLHGGRYRFDIGTAGSVTLVLQALLPTMVACGQRATVTVVGGTDVPAAPPLDYFRNVMLALLARIGIDTELSVRRRGYFPRGGGEVTLAVGRSRLRQVEFLDAGRLRRIGGLAHVAGIDPEVAHRMRGAFVAGLAARMPIAPAMDVAALSSEDAAGSGGAIVAWADTEHALLGAGRVAQRGVRAEALGAAVASELADDLGAGDTVDIHACDQLPVYLALAGGGAFLTRQLTSHARTAIWLAEQFLPVRFECATDGRCIRVRATPREDPRQ